ncbi:helix-turn-helix transcriptional regulator [Sinomicrobium kalidii]|uniref:helix-turn-helix domain-containing protein n=1 Tax=Sinomicrobium kalidii TaxID=2900738 RepID=UPI001E357AA6|nr:helix-turn-helix transcriptional regulator [Sinomicrobium kalidii]UGU15458.1 helix-turn-helix transcriptional regulator [Sinomicrobium kalidii]
MANRIKRIKTINELHKIRALEKPKHPLVSLVDYGQIQHYPENNDVNWIQDFYSIAMKRNVTGKYRYGQQEYDFDEGLMSFLAPKQLLNIVVGKEEKKRSGWILFFHPDFIWHTSLAKSIKQYDFFDYAINEALFLSAKEEQVLQTIFLNIKDEIDANIDDYSQNIIVSQIELLLSYSERFYRRQFITRKKTNHQVLEQLEKLLSTRFEDQNIKTKGIPSVQFIADELNVSPTYLSGILRSLTGLSTQQHIHQKLIEKAKEKLSTTTLSVSEIAYELGFEHVQSFSKLFKSKTEQSPLQFRAGFN